MSAVIEDLWPRCPFHHVDLEADFAMSMLFCPLPMCDFVRNLDGNGW